MGDDKAFPSLSVAVKNATRHRPVTLTVAGSDNSAGAGIQADLKTFSHFGCYGLTAVTCVVAEVPGRVSAIQAIKPEIVAEQVALSFDAFPVGAVKTGMLYSTAIIEAVAEVLQRKIEAASSRLPGFRKRLEAASTSPLVIDPVMVASSGDPLLKKSAITAYKKHLFPRATLVTPNLDELQILSGRTVGNLVQMQECGRFLADQFGCAFLLKGGHLRGREAVDILVTADGVEEFRAPYFRGVDTHGTGCTYSTAITANLAHGHSLSRAVWTAKRYITTAISHQLRWGKTHALEHFPARD